MRPWTLLLILSAWQIACAAWAQSSTDANGKKPPSAVEKKADGNKATDYESLEDLLAEALKHNPDIRVAEAKVREVEAESARMRLHVLAKVGIQHAEIHAARAAEQEGLERYKRVERLFNLKAVAREELDAAKLTFLKLKQETLAMEAKMPYLLGRQPGTRGAAGQIDELIKKKWMELANDSKIEDAEFLRRVMLDGLGRLPTVEETRKFLSMPEKDRRGHWVEGIFRTHDRDPQGLSPANQIKLEPGFADKVRKALDKSYTLHLVKAPPTEVMDFVRSHVQGINLHVRVKAAKKELSLDLVEAVPLGAILQLLEDELQMVFVLRDYGIVVVAGDEALPPGSLRVIDFWKRERIQKTKEPADPNVRPITGDMRGIIEKIDPADSTLVQISIGSDAGLVKGQMLEVFRLQPQPSYAGQIQIVELQPTRSVAKRQYSSGIPLPKVGDQVTPRIAASRP